MAGLTIHSDTKIPKQSETNIQPTKAVSSHCPKDLFILSKVTDLQTDIKSAKVSS